MNSDENDIFIHSADLSGLKNQLRDAEISEQQFASYKGRLIEEGRTAIVENIGNYFVAMGDVLGFKSLLAKNSFPVVCRKYQMLLEDIESASNRDLLTINLDYSSFSTFHVNHIIFSDTVLFWQKIDNSPQVANKNLRHFIDALHLLMINSFLKNIFIRIGVAYGECMILQNKNIFLGKPIAYAYNIEEMQDWIGIAFHNSAIENLPNPEQYNIIKWKVPVKKEHRKSPPLHTLLWKPRIEMLEKIIGIIKNDKKINWFEKNKIIKKYKNTLQFAIAMNSRNP